MRSYQEYLDRFDFNRSEHPDFTTSGALTDLSKDFESVEWSVVISEEDYNKFCFDLQQLAYRYEVDYILVSRRASPRAPLTLRHYSRDIGSIVSSGNIIASNRMNLSFGSGIYCYRACDCTDVWNGDYLDFSYIGNYLQCVYDNDGSKDNLLCPEIFLPMPSLNIRGDIKACKQTIT